MALPAALKTSGPLRLALPAALLLAHAALGLWAVRALSGVFDEPELIGAGFSYWRAGDMRLEPKHPALGLMWNALPLAARRVPFPDGPEWRGGFGTAFGERLLYWNAGQGEAPLQSARLMPLLLSVLVGGALWLSCRRVWGERWALLALAFYCFSPSLLAHSALATTDFDVAGVSTLALLAFAGFLRAPSRGRAAAWGLLAAAAFFCKYTALLLAPALMLAWAVDAALRSRGEALRRLRLGLRWGAAPALGAAAAIFALCPRMRDGFLYQVRFARAGSPLFLLGRAYPAGVLQFYVVAGLVKSSLPELAVFALAAGLLARRRLRVAPEALCAVAVFVVFFLGASFSRKQLGIRYVLPCYCALAVLAAPVGEALARRPKGALLAVALGLWQGACALGAAPDFLSYFNEAAGGPAHGHLFLADSNLDWGQDLKRLGTYLRSSGNPEVILSYFGTASPETYGVRAQQCFSQNKIQRRWMNSERPARELLVVSRTHLQAVYGSPPDAMAWANALEPIAVVGAGLLVYDVTGNNFAHRKLAETYERLGDGPLAARERRRAGEMEPRPKPRELSQPRKGRPPQLPARGA